MWCDPLVKKHKKIEVGENKADAEEVGAVQRNSNVAAEAKSDTNPSAFLPSSRAAAAASFLRFSSSFTFLSWAWKKTPKG